MLCAMACAAQAACSPQGEPGGPAAQVTVSIIPDGYAPTRSSFTWNEDDIRDIQVVVTTEDGEIHDILYSDSPSDLHFTGQVGRLYKLWAAANLGGKVEAGSLEDFTESIRHVSRAGIGRTGIPMFSDGGYGILVTDGENHAAIPLTRMMARVDFCIDTSSLYYPGNFRVGSVTIYSPVDAYVPFAGAVRKEDDGNATAFDSASVQDIKRLNAGGTISLYAFENMQGTLLPGNTDPWRKVPSVIGEHAARCTFLEAVCSYENALGSCDEITYRMYLGEDATTNFDVKRNTVYRLTLEPTEKEIRGGRGSWKIETGEWEDFPPEEPEYSTEYEYELVVSPSSATLAEGETVSFTATYITREYILADGVRISGEPESVTEDDVTATAAWEVTSGSEYVADNGGGSFGWVSGPGSAVISAGYEGRSDTADITTLSHEVVYSTEYEHELVVDPYSATLAAGGSVSFTATYITREYKLADGVRTSEEPVSTSRYDVTEEAEWDVEYGGSYVSNDGNGVFSWADGPGSAGIRATYGEYSDTALITVAEADVEYRDEYFISPESSGITVGQSQDYTIVRYRYSIVNGVEQSGYDSTAMSGDDFTWSSSDDSVATVSGGSATGLDSGTAVITATLNSDTAVSVEATLEVSHTFEFTGASADEVLPGESVDLYYDTTLPDSQVDAWFSTSGFSTGGIGGGTITVFCDADASPGTTVTVTGGSRQKATDTYTLSVGTPPSPEPTVESIWIVELSGNGTDITVGSEYGYQLRCIVRMSDGTEYDSTDPNDAPDFEWWSPDEGNGVTTGFDGWFEVNPAEEGSLVMSCTYEHEYSADFSVSVTEPAAPAVVRMELDEVSGNGQDVYFNGAWYSYKATVTFSDGTVVESTDPAHRNDFSWDAGPYGSASGSGITSSGDGEYYVDGWLDSGEAAYEISCTYDGETCYEYIFVSAPGISYSHYGYRDEGPEYDTLHVYVTLDCAGESVGMEIPYLSGLDVGNGYYRFQISFDCLENGYWTGCSDVVPHGTPAQYNFSVSVDGGSYDTDPPSGL